MTETLKVLGQSLPVKNTLTNLYTVPALTKTTTSSIVACNEGSEEAKIRISIAVAGAADELKQYLYYDVPICKGDSFTATIGMTLAATDIVRVYSNTGQVAFNLFGSEIT